MTLRQFARLGGRARAQALTKQRRTEIAKAAGHASAKARKHNANQSNNR